MGVGQRIHGNPVGIRQLSGRDRLARVAHLLNGWRRHATREKEDDDG